MKTKRAVAALLIGVMMMTNIDVVRADDVVEVAAPSAATTYTSTNGMYEYQLMSDGTKNVAKLTKYLGNETNLTIPAVIDAYEVKEIDYTLFGDGNDIVTDIEIEEGIVNVEQAFCGCTNLSKIQFPASVVYIAVEAFNASNKLEEINVKDGNSVYYSENGVLYFWKNGERYLQSYPAGKSSIDYIVPREVQYICRNAICEPQYLRKVTFSNSSIEWMGSWTVCCPKNPVNIYFNLMDIPTGTMSSRAFYHLPSGSKIYVKNSTVASQIRSYIEESWEVETEVINLADSPSAQVPAKSLTFTDGAVTREMVMGVGERDTSLLTSYVVEPLDTTDNVTWSCSDSSIAEVQPVSGRIDTLKTGKCQIIGQDEHGHTITVNLMVYVPITSANLWCGTDNPETYEFQLGSKSWLTGEIITSEGIRMDVEPANANNSNNVVWESSNPAVAAISVDDRVPGKNYALLEYKTVGTTIITATINDNGTIITKSFKLNITEPTEPTVELIDIGTCSMSWIPTQTYTGAALTPSFTVKHGKTTLVKNKDYTLEYKNNVNAGWATAVVTGIGEYTGSYDKTFLILRNDTGNESDTSIGKGAQVLKVTSSYKKAYGSKPFTVSAKRTRGNGSLSYKSSDKKVVTVSSKGKVTIKGTGVTTITVTAKATSSYKAKSAKIKVTVVPKKETVTYCKSTSAKKLTVKWKKDAKATGYQIQYSTSKKFTSKTTKSVTISKNKTTSTTIKKLKGGKKYYVRIRAYKTTKVSGKTTKLYGSWSKTKSCSIKR